MDPQIIYEDPDILGIVKPAGLLMHPIANAPGREPTLADWLVRRYPEMRKVGDDPVLRPGLVHRLDKDTSGIVVAARTQTAFEYLKNLFQKHEVKKTYLALVAGAPVPAAGIINKPIGIKSGSTKRSVHSDKMRKEAVTEYITLGVFKRSELDDSRFALSVLLAVRPRTGRTHQIRVHLAAIGHPVLGDRIYAKRGSTRLTASRAWVPRLMLHAYSLEFQKSGGGRLRLEAEPDMPFIAVIRAAGAPENLLAGLPEVIHSQAI